MTGEIYCKIECLIAGISVWGAFKLVCLEELSIFFVGVELKVTTTLEAPTGALYVMVLHQNIDPIV